MGHTARVSAFASAVLSWTGVQAQNDVNMLPIVVSPLGSTWGPNVPHALYTHRITGRCLSSPPNKFCNDVLDGCLAEGVETRVLRFAAGWNNQGDLSWDAPPYPPYPHHPPDTTPPPHVPPLPEDVGPWDCESNENPNTFPFYVWSNSHCHYHLKDWARFSLINAITKAPVNMGSKVSAIVPNLCGFPELDPDEPGDVYTNGFDWPGGGGVPTLGCQYVTVPTDLAGEFNVVAEVNFTGSINEGRVFDNVVAKRIRIVPDSLAACPDPEYTYPPTADRPGRSQQNPCPELYGQAIRLDPAWDSGGSFVTGATGATQRAAVVSREINTFDLFYIGTDGRLYRKSQGTTGQWEPGNGAAVSNSSSFVLVGAPAVVARHPGVMHVFARDSADQLRRFTWNGSTVYISHFPLPVASSPAMVAASRDRVLAGWIGTDGAFRFTYMNSGFAFTYPVIVPGATFPTNQTPALVASEKGTIHVFLRTSTGSVMHNARNHVSASWGTWTDLGGAVTGSLAAVSPSLDRVDVFARGADNTLVRKTWLRHDPNPAYCGDMSPMSITWSAWINDDGVSNLDSDPTAISTGEDSIDVFYYYRSPTPTSSTVKYRRRHFNNTVWDQAEDVGTVDSGSATTIPVVASSWAKSTMDVFVQYADGRILARSRR